MSEKTGTPKKSILTTAMEAVENAKPSNMDDEKKETVTSRIKIIGAFAAGVLTTVAVVLVPRHLR